MRSLSNTTFLISVLVTAAACGAKPPLQPPPPGPKLEMSCPAPVVRDATTPQGTDVHFDAPTPTGGRAPYNVQCEPGSSSTFAIGETPVLCTATDADMAQASCGFGVTVRVARTITKTRFMAFGDSITEGAVSLAPRIMLARLDTYPSKLEQMLRERYPAQNIVVTERGKGGEDTRGGAIRLPSELDANKPDVVLLFEGINNINALPTSTQVSSLGTMITDAKSRGAQVMIATVMPVLTTWRHYQPGNTSSKIQALNAGIFALAAQHQLGPPVDLFAIFEANPSLIGLDGLHPSVDGQTRISEAFRDEIVRRYDSSSTTSIRFSAIRTAR